MGKKFKVTAHGTTHDVTPEEWSNATPVVLAGSPHDDTPPDGLQLGLAEGVTRKVSIRTNAAGELFLDFNNE